jgi:hypothetical protein
VTDFASLDPETRCNALVGQYLRRFAELETCLNMAVQSAMALHDLMRFILCANITLREKVSILRAIVDVSKLPEEERKHFKSVLTDILEKCVPNRNMIAHEVFRPDATGEGVEFLRVKAKSGFELPSLVWKIADFQREGAIIEQFSVEVARLVDKIARVEFDYSRSTRLITLVTPVSIPDAAILRIPESEN